MSILVAFFCTCLAYGDFRTGKSAYESGQLLYARDELNGFVEQNKSVKDPATLRKVEEARFLLGKTCMALGLYNEAERHFSLSSKSSEYGLISQVRLAECLYAQSQIFGIDPEKKLAYLNKAVENMNAFTKKTGVLNDNAELLNDARRLLAFSLQGLGKHRPAVKILLEIETDSKKYTHLDDVLYGLGYSYYHLGKYFEATQYLENLIKKYPSYKKLDYAKYYLAENYFYLEDWKAAATQYAAVIETLAKTKNQAEALLLQEARFSLGWAYYKTKNYKESLQQFQAIANLPKTDPKMPSIVFKIGELYYRLGERSFKNARFSISYDHELRDEVKKQFVEAINFLQKKTIQDNKQLLPYSYIYIGDSFFNLGLISQTPAEFEKAFDNAEKWYDKFDAISKTLADKTLELYYIRGKGLISYHRAIKARKEGKGSFHTHSMEAKRLLSILEEQDNKDLKVTAMLYLANLFQYSLTDIPKAVDRYILVIEDATLQPYINQSEIMLALAESYFKWTKMSDPKTTSGKELLKKMTSAIQWVSKIIADYKMELAPEKVYNLLLAHNLKGEIHLYRNEYLSAVENFRAVFEKKHLPKTPPFENLRIKALESTGNAYFNIRQYPEAIAIFNRLLGEKTITDESKFNAYTQLITCHKNVGEFEKAIAIGIKMLDELDLSLGKHGIFSAAKIYYDDMGRPADALKTLELLLKKVGPIKKSTPPPLSEIVIEAWREMMEIHFTELKKAVERKNTKDAKRSLTEIKSIWDILSKTTKDSLEYFKAGKRLADSYLAATDLSAAEDQYKKMLARLKQQMAKDTSLAQNVSYLVPRINFRLGVVFLKKAEKEITDKKAKAKLVDEAVTHLNEAAENDKNSNASSVIAVDSTYLLGQAYLMHPTMPEEEKYKNAIYKGFWKVAYVYRDKTRSQECIERAVEIFVKWIAFEIETGKPLTREKTEKINQMIQFARRMVNDIDDINKVKKYGTLLDEIGK